MSEYIYEHVPSGADATGNSVETPTLVQREEIVRCRDCRYGNEVTWPTWSNIPHDYLDCTGELVETWDYYNDQPSMNPVKPDGFCAWGCRKSE